MSRTKRARPSDRGERVSREPNASDGSQSGVESDDPLALLRGPANPPRGSWLWFGAALLAWFVWLLFLVAMAIWP